MRSSAAGMRPFPVDMASISHHLSIMASSAYALLESVQKVGAPAIPLIWGIWIDNYWSPRKANCGWNRKNGGAF